jgi:hypothetical protein
LSGLGTSSNFEWKTCHVNLGVKINGVAYSSDS